MRSRIRCSTVGWVARTKVSVQPVHSCPESQMTGGRFLAAVAASAILGPKLAGRPICTAVAVDTLRKSLRDTPAGIFSKSASLHLIDNPPYIGLDSNFY